MGAVEELNAKVDALQAAQVQVGVDLGAALDRVAQDVAFLKQQAGQGADLTEAIAKIEGSTQALRGYSDTLKSVDPVPENPQANG